MVLNTAITSKPVSIATSTTLPANVYETETDVYHMTFSQSIWIPNDDTTLYDLGVYDNVGDTDGPYIGGRRQPIIGQADPCGFLNIPNGWRATNIFVDIHSNHADTLYEPLDGGGPRPGINYTIYEVKTWTTADPIVPATDGPKTIGGVVTTATANILYELDETMVGAIDNAMWILLATGATWHMVAGGYVVIEEI